MAAAPRLLAGNIQNAADSGTATVNGSVNFGATIRSLSVSNANATLAITGNLTNAGQLNMTGQGTIDLQGNNIGLTNSTGQIGQQNAAGPTVVVHNANSLGSALQLNYNSGTIYGATAVTFGTSITQSLGSASTAGNQFTNKYDGANLTFLGSVHLFNNNTLDQRITVNNTTTFAGGWTASTGTTASPSVVVNGSPTGILALGGTIDLDKPIVDSNGHGRRQRPYDQCRGHRACQQQWSCAQWCGRCTADQPAPSRSVPPASAPRWLPPQAPMA